MMIKVAINGFGRIGRLTFRELLKKKNVEVVAINDLTDAPTLAHLLRYDSSQGRFDGEVTSSKGEITVNGKSIKLYAQRDPEDLPWKELNVDVVAECTGIFRDEAGAGKHLTAGAKRVIISAPAQGDVKTVVIGVNDDSLTSEHKVVSNASCTTNCLAPIAMLFDREFGIEKGYINTIHAYTADQSLQDSPHKDLRRARAAAVSIIPTTTGAAKSVGLVLPQLQGKLDGIATRVPTLTGSMTDFVVVLKKEVTKEEVNKVIRDAAENELKGIVEYTEDPIVSADIVGNTHSSIFDADMTIANGNFVKVLSWYDNEYGYASRTAELAAKEF
ncbi:MAG: type I glyceraldehyde-3-phosphate dehydrogenase [Cryomorphaceae bacterium]|nr:type I glyceraldehyde-3-phosphate dehydrogenase [Flavobacteriales bacterium]